MSQEDEVKEVITSVEALGVDDSIIRELAQVADNMSAMVVRMLEGQAGQSKDIDHFRETLKEMRESIRRIAKVLHEGNGEKPLIARVAVLENQVQHLHDDVQSVKDKEQADNNGRYAVLGAVVSGIFALATSVIALFS